MGEPACATSDDGAGEGANRRRGGRPVEGLDPELGCELTVWARWMKDVVDDAWPTRKEAARAVGERDATLSHYLHGTRMPSREWLDDVFFPAVQHAGGEAGAEERRQARVRYMTALKSFEKGQKDSPGTRRARRTSWQEYTLRDRVAQAAQEQELLRRELAETCAQQRAAQQELHSLRDQWRSAHSELEKAQRDVHAVTLRQRTEHERQLTHARRLVRELEEQIQARELQRRTMLERIRSQQLELHELRTVRNALEYRLAELKRRYAWRREAERRLKQQLDFKRQALNVTAGCTGVATAAWLVDGFTIADSGVQRIPSVLACVVGVGLLYMVLCVLVLPVYAALAIPAAAAARRNTRRGRRRAELIVSSLAYAGTAAPFVLYPLMLWLSARACREWFALPITLQGGLPAVLAALLVLVTAVLVQMITSGVRLAAELARWILNERRDEQRDTAAV